LPTLSLRYSISCELPAYFYDRPNQPLVLAFSKFKLNSLRSFPQ